MRLTALTNPQVDHDIGDLAFDPVLTCGTPDKYFIPKCESQVLLVHSGLSHLRGLHHALTAEHGTQLAAAAATTTQRAKPVLFEVKMQHADDAFPCARLLRVSALCSFQAAPWCILILGPCRAVSS